MLGTVIYFIITQKKIVELKVVSTAIELETPSVNRRMSETPWTRRAALLDQPTRNLEMSMSFSSAA